MTNKKKGDLVACEVLRDYWISEEEQEALELESPRIRKGTIVEVSTEAAMAGMEADVLKRVKARK